MATGRFLHLPRAGGMLDQDSRLMHILRGAWRVWHINVYKMANHLPVGEDDDAFMEWVTANA